MNNLVKDSIEKFIESLKSNKKVANMLSELSEKIRRNIKGSGALNKEIIKISKSKGYTFTEKDISEYFKETVNELKDEDLKKASGGVGENMSFGQKLAVGAAGLGLGIGGAGLAMNFIGGNSNNNTKDVSKVQKHDDLKNRSKGTRESDMVKDLTTKKDSFSDDDLYLDSSNEPSGRSSGSYYGNSSYGGKNSSLGSRSKYGRGTRGGYSYSAGGYSYEPGSGYPTFGSSSYDFSNGLTAKGNKNANQFKQNNMNKELEMFENAVQEIKSLLENHGYNLSSNEIKRRLVSAIRSGEWSKVKSDEDIVRVLTKGLEEPEKVSQKIDKNLKGIPIDEFIKTREKESKLKENPDKKEKTIDELINEGEILVKQVGNNQKSGDKKKDQLNGNIAFVSQDLIPDDGDIKDIVIELKNKYKDLQAIFITKPKSDKVEEIKLSNLPKDVKQISRDKIKNDNILEILSITYEANKTLNNTKEGIGRLKIKDNKDSQKTIASVVMTFKGEPKDIANEKTMFGRNTLTYNVKENKDLHVLVVPGDFEVNKDKNNNVKYEISGIVDKFSDTNIVVIPGDEDESSYKKLLETGWEKVNDERWFKMLRFSKLKKSVVLVKKDSAADKLSKDTVADLTLLDFEGNEISPNGVEKNLKDEAIIKQS